MSDHHLLPSPPTSAHAQGTRLLLVRHGETLANREFRYVGQRDDALSERGLQQAQSLSQALTIFPIAAIYSSPLQRAYQTAEAIAQPLALPVHLEQNLREGNFGAWKG